MVRPKRPPLEWERLIGMKFLGAVGALLVVFAMVLLFKYLYDKGLLNMSPVWKCISGTGFGLFLLLVGEIVYRRINAFASAGFTAAGLGTMYASTLAAYGLFELFGPVPAFALLALCAGIGIALSARARLVSVAVLSLVGGYSALFLVVDSDPSPWMVPAFLLMLLGVGLALSGWLRGSFVVVRTLVWWATILIGGGWVDSVANPTTFVYGTVFVAFVWSMVHGELFAAARGSKGAYEPIRVSEPLKWKRVRAVAVSFSTTAWCAGLGAFLFYSSQSVPNWMSPMAGVAATLVGWNLLASHLRVLKEVPTSDAERLGAGLAMQAGGLLFAAISLGLSGQAEVVLWLVLGIGAMLAGRWIVARSLHVYGLVSLGVGTARLLLYDSWSVTGSAEPIAGLVPSVWMLLAFIGGASWLVGAWSLQSTTGIWARLRNFEIGLGLTVIFLAFMNEQASTYSLTLVSIAFCLVTLTVARWRQSSGLAGYAIGCLAISTGVIFVPMYWAHHAPNIESLGLVLSWWSFLMLLTASAWTVCTRLLLDMRESWWTEVRRVTIGVVIVLIFGAWFDEAGAPLSMLLVWLLLSHALGVASRRNQNQPFDIFAPLGLLASLGMWVYGFVVLGWGYADLPAILHPGLWSSFALAVSLPILCGPLARNEFLDDESRQSLRNLSYGLAVLLVLVSTSYEAIRIGAMVSSDSMSQRAILTIWWGVFGFGLIVAGFRVRVPPARYAGLALIVIATGKAILFDLNETEGLWRVASIIGPGLLMLLIAAGYAKVSAAVAQAGVGDSEEWDSDIASERPEEDGEADGNEIVPP